MSITAHPSLSRSSQSSAWRRGVVNGLLAVSAMAQEMTFIEHLEELRRRILWSVVCLAGTFAGVLDVRRIFLRDRERADSREPRRDAEGIAAAGHLRPPHESHAGGVDLLRRPRFLLSQAWLFISPGLHRHERRYAIPLVLSASLLFIAGGAFGYYIAFPTALRLPARLDCCRRNLTPIIDAVQYFDLFFSIMVALGIVFQIPAVIFVLSRIGLVSARLLVHYFKHAVLACVVVAAVITPTTDFRATC